MKKTLQSALLVLILTIGIFAGDAPGGGKTACQTTPSLPCFAAASQNDNPEVSFPDYVWELIKNVKLF
jgi:hypothetical protein